MVSRFKTHEGSVIAPQGFLVYNQMVVPYMDKLWRSNMRENKRARRERLSAALEGLEKAYPEAKPALEFSSPFELLVATMLSAQCTDKQVNKTTRTLFPVYHTAEAFAGLDEDTLCGYIKGCGLYRAKSKNIIAAAKILTRDYGGEVPADRDALMELPGVGRKTANVVVSNAFNIDAIAVDTHVFRVANRIGLAAAKDVLNTEKQLMESIPQAKWSKAHHWLIYHGRGVCSARNPKCAACPISAYCGDYINREEIGRAIKPPAP